MLENLANLYQALIIEHSRNPKHSGMLDSSTSKKQLGINPSCGDKLLLSLDIQNGKIHDIKHESDGCSIFISSCSLMSELLIGKTIGEAENIIDLFTELIASDLDRNILPEKFELLGKLQVFTNISHYPARVKCALLFARTLQNLIKNYDVTDNQAAISTEDIDI